MSRILKYWVCLLAPLTLLLSCVKERTETEVPTGRTIHYRATVTEGTDTRATLNNSNQYIFQEGDRLFVSNTDSGREGWLSGVLTLVSGAGETTAVFEGDLTLDTGNHDTDKEDFYLEADATLSATLVSTADRIHNASGALTGYPEDEYATTFADAVAMFSHFTDDDSQFSDRSFTLTQHSSFLINTITFDNTVAANTPVAVKLYNNNDRLLRSFTVSVDANHQAKFVTAFGTVSPLTLTNAKLSAQIQNDEQEYLFNINDGTLAANNYYNIARSAIIVPEANLFAIQARQATTVTFNYTTGLEYSSDRYNWTSYSSGIEMAQNEVLYFRATGNKYQNNNDATNPLFTVTENTNVYIYGDIMALMSNANSLTQNNAFNGTFKNATWIDIPDGKDLVLSATTLTNSCYKQMFMGCTGLSKTPVLPGGEVALTANCYESIFQGCTNLTSGPSLPASSLANSCYKAMFKNSGLTSAPALNATTLVEACYYSMFEGCTGLALAPALNATTLAASCYQAMFKGCTSLSTSSSPIFLPASTLETNCYYEMFNGASGVNEIICLATDISAENCTYNWLKNVSASGTFWKVYSTGWTTGPSAIPSSWVAKDYGIPIFPNPPFDGEIDL